MWLADGRVVGWEALLRPRSGEAAQDYIRRAEEEGQALRLNLLILRTLAQGPLPAEGWLFVNLHAATVSAVTVGACAISYPPELAARIVWELPEERGWPYDGDAVRVLRERLPGGRLALDDVGTGWADLARIVAIRPDYIKLTLPLVRGIHQDPARQVAVWAIAEAAKRIGAQVIAEGVEQPQESRCLESLGIRLAQGFLFGRQVPLPLDYHNA